MHLVNTDKKTLKIIVMGYKSSQLLLSLKTFVIKENCGVLNEKIVQGNSSHNKDSIT